MNRPRLFSVAELSGILRDMADRVEAGDSFEGNIGYTALGREFPDIPAGMMEVQGCYRIGNLEGQGGMRLLGEAGR